MEKLTDIRNTMLDDARVFMEQLTTLINNGAIDYEEYYNINVIQGDKDLNTDNIAYGVYYGAYGSRFYNPGDAAFRKGIMILPPNVKNPDHLGVDCAVPLVPPFTFPLLPNIAAAPQYCDITYTDSKDKNEGQNPWDAGSGTTDQNEANAFCDNTLLASIPCPVAPDPTDYFEASELYIITNAMSAGGKIQKYIVATQPLNGDGDKIAVLSIMNGLDVDGNNVIDMFRCEGEGRACHENTDDPDLTAEGFYDNYPEDFDPVGFDPDEAGPKDPYKYSLPLYEDHRDEFSVTQPSFFPITPFRTSIKNIQFIISPVDDPYKAYNENDMKMHPTVTILLTVEPYYADQQRYPGGWESAKDAITIQRTVTAGIKEIESFPPTYDLNWICELLGGMDCPDYDYPW